MLSDGENTVQAQQWLDKCYLDSTPSEITVNRWYADFRRSRTDTNDAELSVHPNSAVVLENTKKLHNLVLADRKLKLCKIAKLEISEGSVFTILHEHLSIRKLCSKWVRRLLTVAQKQQRVDNSERCLQLFPRNKKEFLRKYVTMKYGSTTSLKSQIGSQLSGEQQGKTVQSDQRRKHQQAMFWPSHFGMHKIFCWSITLRKVEPSIVNITQCPWCNSYRRRKWTRRTSSNSGRDW